MGAVSRGDGTCPDAARRSCCVPRCERMTVRCIGRQAMQFRRSFPTAKARCRPRSKLSTNFADIDWGVPGGVRVRMAIHVARRGADSVWRLSVPAAPPSGGDARHRPWRANSAFELGGERVVQDSLPSGVALARAWGRGSCRKSAARTALSDRPRVALPSDFPALNASLPPRPASATARAIRRPSNRAA